MDRDDRQDDKMAADETRPQEATNTQGITGITVNGPSEDSSDTLTHSIPNVQTTGTAVDIEPAEIETIETITIDPEVEPTTIAFTPGKDTVGASDQPPQPVSPDTSSLQPDAPAATLSHIGKKDKKNLLIAVAASVVLFIVIGVLAWWMLGSSKSTESDTDNSAQSMPIEQPKLGIALSVVDNTVEYSTGGTEWEPASTDTQLEEGNFVRTAAESRAVLVLDDGSAIRLDASSQVKLVDLSADNVRIEQVEGTVYSRVVPSDRTYTVAIEDTTYEALGTAFVTVKKETESGVQVYQSAVKTSDSDEEVTEGKQFYKINNVANLQGKLSDIDIDALINNAFVNWNLAQDEGDANFKDRLGILSQIKERSAALEAERLTAEQVAKEKAALALQEKQTEEKEESSDEAKVTRGTMTLDRSGKTFTWNYTGKAIYGYKFVYSTKTSTPTFGSNDSVYFSDMGQTSGQLPKSITDGIYYVRVCAYTANTEDDKCVDYSNFKKIEL